MFSPRRECSLRSAGCSTHTFGFPIAALAGLATSSFLPNDNPSLAPSLTERFSVDWRLCFREFCTTSISAATTLFLITTELVLLPLRLPTLLFLLQPHKLMTSKTAQLTRNRSSDWARGIHLLRMPNAGGRILLSLPNAVGLPASFNRY